ncbi:helix-turn-helix transcriptional regulator [Kitasatospora sp. NPDC001574]
MEYELTFVVSGATVDDEAVDKLRESLDALLFRAGGLDLLTVAASGENAVDAALHAVTALSSEVPKIRIHRLDRELVGIQEIADRTERTRQNVAQWVKGERLADGEPFPLAEGTAGRSQVWLWSEVNTWLERHGLGDGCVYPTRREMAFIDHALLTSTTLTFTFDAPDDAFTPQRRAVCDEVQTSKGFLEYLAERTETIDNLGRHVIVAAAAEEPAVDVVQRIAGYEHDVVLTTVTDRLVGVVMTSRPLSKPTRLVSVPLDATVRDWVELILQNPGSAFVLSSAGKVTPIETVLRDAA